MVMLILMSRINLRKASKGVKIEERIGTEGGKHDNEVRLEFCKIIIS